MKQCILIALTALSFFSARAQESGFQPNVTVKWAPTGLLLGSVSLQAEYKLMGRSSLTAKIGIPANTHRSFEYDGRDAEFDMKATSFLAGYRMYLSRKKQLSGLYFEPYFKYVHHTAEGTGETEVGTREVTMSFTNNYNGVGVGGQLGAQFLIGKRFVIDLFFLGPEINSSKNRLRAIEISNAIPWTQFEASDAEANIRDFIDQFPFVGNRTTVAVDRQNKSVSADFKGALPGFRIGVSLGIAL